MAQINLLKQKKSNTDAWQIISSLSVKLLALCLLALIGYYIYLVVQVRRQTTAAIDMEVKISEDKKSMEKVADRDELFTRQLQLQQLDSLVDAHLYWSGLLPALQAVTLKSVKYSSIQAANDGTLDLSVNIPDTVELDKFLQVFDQPDISKNFYDIRIGSIGRNKIGDAVVTTVEVRLKYNGGLLQYGAANK